MREAIYLLYLRLLKSKIIERHLTFDPDAEGLDHSSSLEVNEFYAMIADIRMVEASLGHKHGFKPR